jgi:hypothetical protein
LSRTLLSYLYVRFLLGYVVLRKWLISSYAYATRPLLELIGPPTSSSGNQSFIRAGFGNMTIRGLNAKIQRLSDLGLLSYAT